MKFLDYDFKRESLNQREFNDDIRRLWNNGKYSIPVISTSAPTWVADEDGEMVLSVYGGSRRLYVADSTHADGWIFFDTGGGTSSTSAAWLSSGATISGAVTVGTIVYLSGASEVAPADATDNTKPAIAICREVDGTTAYLQQVGEISNVKTEAAANISRGDKLFLAKTAGTVTKTMPVGAGNIGQLMGIALSDEVSNLVNVLLAIDYNPPVF